MNDRHVAVVGAGPAGLAAAWQLTKAGHRVTLYDAREQAGGRMRSDELDGCTVDPGVQLFGSTYASLFQLAAEAGASSLIRRSPGRDALWRDGRPHTITYGSVASLIASTALPLGLKLRLGARYLPFLATHARHLDANDPARTGGAELDVSSVAEWGVRELGEDFVELLAHPLLAAYYGGAPEQMSVALYHAVAKVGTDVRVHAVRGGMGALSARLLAALRERAASWRGADPVARVQADEAGVLIEAATGGESYDAAVIAVPVRAAEQILSPTGPFSDWLARVETAPTATVALVAGRPVRADFFGLSFPRQTAVGEKVVVACVEDRKIAGLVPPGRSLLVIFPAPAVAPAVVRMESEDAVNLLLPAVTEAFPEVAGHVERARLYRFPEGYSLFGPGHLRHILRFDAGWLSPRLALAGEYLIAPTVEGAVVSGMRAAGRLIEAQARGR